MGPVDVKPAGTDVHEYVYVPAPPEALAITTLGDVVLLIDYIGIYTLYVVYVDVDNIVHLSTTDIGGIIHGGDRRLNVEEYNRRCVFEKSKIVKVIYLKDDFTGKFKSIIEFNRFISKYN